MPIGWGWHPYFKLEDQLVDDLNLKLSKVNQINCDARMIPLGTEQLYTDFSTSKTIHSTQLDTCFRSIEEQNKVLVSLESQDHQLSIWQNAKHYPFVQIYTPDDRKSIAIEPMTCGVNAFNNQATSNSLLLEVISSSASTIVFLICLATASMIFVQTELPNCLYICP